MRTIDVIQGSVDWELVRLGRPTSSQFHRLITATGKASTSAEGYLNELLAEWAIGEPCHDFKSDAMMRGTELEQEAADYYEYEYDVTLQKVGFVTTNDGRIGCSPDRLVGNEGLLEIKNPLAPKHVGYLRGTPADDYKVQFQGQLYVCDEREWVDLLSYNPVMPRALVRCVRDEQFQSALYEIMEPFLDRLDAEKEKLRAMGVVSLLEQKLADYERVSNEIEELFPD